MSTLKTIIPLTLGAIMLLGCGGSGSGVAAGSKDNISNEDEYVWVIKESNEKRDVMGGTYHHEYTRRTVLEEVNGKHIHSTYADGATEAGNKQFISMGHSEVEVRGNQEYEYKTVFIYDDNEPKKMFSLIVRDIDTNGYSVKQSTYGATSDGSKNILYPWDTDYHDVEYSLIASRSWTYDINTMEALTIDIDRANASVANIHIEKKFDEAGNMIGTTVSGDGVPTSRYSALYDNEGKMTYRDYKIYHLWDDSDGLSQFLPNKSFNESDSKRYYEQYYTYNSDGNILTTTSTDADGTIESVYTYEDGIATKEIIRINGEIYKVKSIGDSMDDDWIFLFFEEDEVTRNAQGLIVLAEQTDSWTGYHKIEVDYDENNNISYKKETEINNGITEITETDYQYEKIKVNDGDISYVGPKKMPPLNTHGLQQIGYNYPIFYPNDLSSFSVTFPQYSKEDYAWFYE